MSVDGSLWYVKLADGDVERVTLDQLDEAFQKGQIDESSMVLAAGSDKWMTLADLLSDSAPEPATPVAFVPQVAPPVVAANPQPAMPPIIAAPMPAPIVAPAPQPARQAPTPIMAPTAVARGPVAMPVVPGIASIPVASSLRPVSVDLSGPLSIDEPTFRRSSKRGWAIGALVAVLAIGGGAFFIVKQTTANAASDPVPTFAAAAAQPPPAPAPSPETIAPQPVQPQTTPMAPSPVMDPTQRLTDAQRDKLIAADKDKKSKKGKSTRSTGGSSSHAPTKDRSTGFTTSGNKYDPLNSTL